MPPFGGVEANNKHVYKQCTKQVSEVSLVQRKENGGCLVGPLRVVNLWVESWMMRKKNWWCEAGENILG